VNFTIEYEQEEDGRWLAEVIELLGVLAYGDSPEEAVDNARMLAHCVLVDRRAHHEGSGQE